VKNLGLFGCRGGEESARPRRHANPSGNSDNKFTGGAPAFRLTIVSFQNLQHRRPRTGKWAARRHASKFSHLRKKAYIQNWLKVGFKQNYLVGSYKIATPAVGAIATLRGVVISAERGVLPSEVTFITAPNSRKARDAAAADALRRAEVLIVDLLRDDLMKIRDAEQILRQIIAVANYKGYLKIGNGSMAYGDFVVQVWKWISEDSDLAQGAVNVTALVGFPNALALLRRELP